MIVSNISHLTGTRGIGIRLAGEVLRPGQTRDVPAEAITRRHQKMFGAYLCRGHIPADTRVAAPPEPMSPAEAQSFLGGLSLSALHALADAVFPPLSKRANHARMVHSLLRALRSADLDPEKFFFLRRWTRSGNTFVPVE